MNLKLYVHVVTNKWHFRKKCAWNIMHKCKSKE